MSDVNHPSYYHPDTLEAIDVIEAWGLDFNLGNALKYLARANHKGDYLADLYKARWYINRAISQRIQAERPKNRDERGVALPEVARPEACPTCGDTEPHKKLSCAFYTRAVGRDGVPLS